MTDKLKIKKLPTYNQKRCSVTFSDGSVTIIRDTAKISTVRFLNFIQSKLQGLCITGPFNTFVDQFRLWSGFFKNNSDNTLTVFCEVQRWKCVVVESWVVPYKIAFNLKRLINDNHFLCCINQALFNKKKVLVKVFSALNKRS